MKVRFLLDENRSPVVTRALLRHDPAIDVLRIGDAGAPPLGPPDPDILLYCEASQRALVTSDLHSMLDHVAAHLAAGHHHWGVFRLARSMSVGLLADALYLIWAASEAEEWTDRFAQLPL